MSKDPTLDLTGVATDDLLAAVSAAPGRAPDPVDIWLESAGIYPGTTRVPAHELYQQYCRFMQTRTDLGTPLAIRTWGKRMVTRFKVGKGKHWNFYYISRERVVEIPPNILGGG